jgi:hypothetical protein
LPHELRLLAHADGQGRAQFQPRRVGRLLDAELGEQGRRPGEKQRANFSRRQARQLGLVAVDEAPAAARSALGQHGDTGAAQRVHVAKDRALRHFEA